MKILIVGGDDTVTASCDADNEYCFAGFCGEDTLALVRFLRSLNMTS
jgi:hypothetical protein